jgi:hypothetical protein
MIPCNWKRSIVALIIASSFLPLMPRRAQACGPFFTDAIFVFTVHPDFPLEEFAAGKLGIVSPNWARSYLVVAYRNLSGSPLSPAEAKGMTELWKERLGLDSYSDEFEGTNQWKEARKKVSGAPEGLGISVFRNREKPHDYESFLNCQTDAFATAVALLNERIGRFGADSAQTRDWLAAQDTVFMNCGEGRHIPEAAAGADALIQADRAYQIAAANFYATNYDEAKEQFDAIAKDKSSPYRLIAPYLAARAMLRKGSLAEKEADAAPSLTDAEARLQAILKDNSLSRSHAMAARLLNLTRLRLHPETKLHELARGIVKKEGSTNFKQDVWDYTVLMDKFVGDSDADETKPATEVSATLKSDDLTDWIVNVQDESAKARPHSIQRWEQTKALPWLIAAMMSAEPGDAKTNDLLNAAARVEHSSPGFASIAYYTTRLLMESGRADAARTYVDKVLANDRQYLDASAINDLMAKRTLLAQNLADFLNNVQRKPAAFSDDYDGREIPTDGDAAKAYAKDHEFLFDTDAANIFNKAMPVAVIKDAARANVLAANLKRDVAQAAFIRAALLDDRESALEAAPVLQSYYPELKEFLAAYQRATTPDARRFAAAFMALKYPGLRPFVSTGIGRSTSFNEIDSYRDNYWCAEPPPPLGGAPSDEEEEGSKAKTITPPEFLKGSQATAARQFAALQSLGTAPNFLCRTAIAWTEKNPNDPRSPEALHLAVRSTRYGCTDQETGQLSKAAFDLLHKRYPNTTWARNTKYWFKG